VADWWRAFCIALLALMARYVAVLALVLSQVSGTPLFVVESGKIQTRLVQGFFRGVVSESRADGSSVMLTVMMRNPVLSFTGQSCSIWFQTFVIFHDIWDNPSMWGPQDS